MAEVITIKMRLFGAFRTYGETVDFILPRGSSGKDIKAKLAALLKINDATLIGDSVLANDNEIIDDSAVFTTNSALAILPPVCGG